MTHEEIRIDIDDELAAKVEALADRIGTSVSDIVAARIEKLWAEELASDPTLEVTEDGDGQAS